MDSRNRGRSSSRVTYSESEVNVTVTEPDSDASDSEEQTPIGGDTHASNNQTSRPRPSVKRGATTFQRLERDGATNSRSLHLNPLARAEIRHI